MPGRERGLRREVPHPHHRPRGPPPNQEVSRIISVMCDLPQISYTKM